jgi:hypothetical protein
MAHKTYHDLWVTKLDISPHSQQQQNPNNLKNDEKDMKYLDLLITLK